VILTDGNFRKKVLDSGAPWLVEFYAPWCGHCQRLEPEWKEAASEVFEKTGDKVKLGMVDATQEQQIAQQYGVQGKSNSLYCRVYIVDRLNKANQLILKI